jgi:hypothetical protein
VDKIAHFISGTQLQLRGNLSFLWVTPYQIATGAIQMEVLGLQNHVVIIAEGGMMHNQRNMVMKRRKVRPEKIIDAVKWLKENNKHWKNIDLDDIKCQAHSVEPIFINMSHKVQSENANIKQRETFTCYFPDGTTTDRSGSYNGNAQAAFKQKVKDLKEKGFEFELKVDIEHEFVNGAALDEFVNACLLQFPYGVGGINDKREKPDGTFASCQSIAEYL